MDASKVESKRLLRSLELKAFRCVVDALRAQGSLTLNKRQVLEYLASTLKIGSERCRSEIRRAVNDNVLSYIASSNNCNTEENWNLESARRVAFMPMVASPSVFTALADNVSDAIISQWQNHAQRNPNLTEIIEMKKSEANMNSYNFQKANLFIPFRSTITASLEDVAVELEKINSIRTPLSDNLPDYNDKRCLSSSRVKDAFSSQLKRRNTVDVLNDDIDDVTSEEVSSNNLSIVASGNKRIFSSKKRSDSEYEYSPWTKRSKYSEVSASLDNQTDQSMDKVENKSKVIETNICTGTNNSELSRTADIRTEVIQVENNASSKSSTLIESCETNKLPKSNVCLLSTENCESQDSHFSSEMNLLINKDLTIPHMFNLIPVSRRLKLMKKTEQSTFLNKLPPSSSLPPTYSDSATPQPPCSLFKENNSLSAPTHRINSQNIPSLNFVSSNDQSLQSDSVAEGCVTKTEQYNLSQNLQDCTKSNYFETKEASNIIILPMSSESKKTLSLLGNIKVRNLNEKISDNTFDEHYLPFAECRSDGQDDRDSDGRISETYSTSDSENNCISMSECTESFDEIDSSDNDSIVYWNSDCDEDEENECSDNNNENCVDYVYADEESNGTSLNESLKTISNDEDDDVSVCLYEIVSDDCCYKTNEKSDDQDVSSKKMFQKQIELTTTSLSDASVPHGSMSETTLHKLERDESLRKTSSASTITTTATTPQQTENSGVASDEWFDPPIFIKPNLIRRKNSTHKSEISSDNMSLSEKVSSDDFKMPTSLIESITVADFSVISHPVLEKSSDLGNLLPEKSSPVYADSPINTVYLSTSLLSNGVNSPTAKRFSPQNTTEMSGDDVSRAITKSCNGVKRKFVKSLTFPIPKKVRRLYDLNKDDSECTSTDSKSNFLVTE